jgi:hypothetical protein
MSFSPLVMDIHTSVGIATNAPSPLRGEGWGEGESGGHSNITLSPTPLPSRERGFRLRQIELTRG